MSKVILTRSHIKISKQKLYFDLKYPEMTTPEEEVRLQVPLPSSQCALLLPKNPLLFLIGPFIFHTCLFVFQKCLLFISQKCSIVFQNYPLVSQKRLLFIYSEHLFPRMRFFQLLVPSCSAQGWLQRWYLSSSCFASFWNSLLTNLWLFIDNLNPSTWSMIFHALRS